MDQNTPHDETPLTPEQEGLLELAEFIADEHESGAVMLLSFEEAAFMEQVCQYDALIVPFAAIAAHLCYAVHTRMRPGQYVVCELDR